MIYLEKFTFFGKNNKLNKLNLIKRAENKIAKGEVNLKVTYFSGEAINKSIIIEIDKGSISFRKHNEKYQLKYFPNNPVESTLVFDIEKEKFDGYWDTCVSKGITPKEETWIPSVTNSRLGKVYKK